MPDPPPLPARDPLIDPDANRRRQIGLRAPLESSPIPDPARERFSENWQRMAAEPRREHRGRAHRRPNRSLLTRWLFTDGRFDLGAAAGPVLLLALLVAAFIYGRRILGG
jgi:hypothetical protein